MNGLIFRFIAVGITLSLSVGASAKSEQVARDRDWYADAVQNVISYYGEDGRAHQVEDLFAGEEVPVLENDHIADKWTLTFNDEPTTLKQLAQQMKNSDSICLNGVDFGQQNGLATDLADILLLIGETEIEEQFINLNLEYIPRQQSMDCDIIQIAPDGALLLAGEPIQISDLSALLPDDREVGIESVSGKPLPFSTLLEVVQTIGSKKIHHIFAPNRDQQVEISAEIYQLNTNGVRDVLAAPRVTTQPGYTATMRVVENASGMKPYHLEQDAFHQEDLANLGIRFSVIPQIIGDYIRISGIAVLTKSASRQEVFQKEGVPVYSYTVDKTVAPFAVVLNVLNDGAEFPVADVDGVKTRCRLSAITIDHMGMSRKDRDMARSMGGTQTTQTDRVEYHSKQGIQDHR